MGELVKVLERMLWMLRSIQKREEQQYFVILLFKMLAEPFIHHMLKVSSKVVQRDDGRLQNAGFLDYRVPVASDLPMIDTIIVEVPSDNHPFGVRGVGETGIAPPLPAIANAIADATGKRLRHLPISPPKVLRAIKESS
jgi:hypothetical protein